METRTFGMEGISESQGRWKGVDGSLVWREGCSKEGKAWGSGEQRTLQRAPFEPHWICQSSQGLRTE